MSKTSATRAQLSTKAEEVFWGLWASVFYAKPPSPRSVLIASANHREGASLVAASMAVAGASAAGPPAAAPTEPEPAEDIGQDEPADEIDPLDEIGELAEAGEAAESWQQAPAAAAPASAPGGGVLLIDFNLRTPVQHRLFGVGASPGLSEVLRGRRDLASAVHRFGPGNLHVLTVGGQTEPLSELLKADRVRSFLDSVGEQYPYVVVDAPPANQYPDAQVLAGIVGTVVLVAQAQRTSREALLQARKRMELSSARVAGVVLNKRTYPIPKFVYKRV